MISAPGTRGAAQQATPRSGRREDGVDHHRLTPGGGPGELVPHDQRWFPEPGTAGSRAAPLPQIPAARTWITASPGAGSSSGTSSSSTRPGAVKTSAFTGAPGRDMITCGIRRVPRPAVHDEIHEDAL